jgi:carboxyl-terminal processing protease
VSNSSGTKFHCKIKRALILSLTAAALTLAPYSSFAAGAATIEIQPANGQSSPAGQTTPSGQSTQPQQQPQQQQPTQPQQPQPPQQTEPAPATEPTPEEISEAQFNQVFDLLRSYHVSGVTDRELSDTAIKAMIDSLEDPYTVYMSEDEYSEFTNSLEQKVVGVGIRVSKDEDGFYAVAILPNSPALEMGMQADDYIKAVDGKDVDGIDLDELVKRITGPEGTPVELTLLRDGKTTNVTFTRRAISAPAVESHLLNGGVGYISLSTFSGQADEEFTARLNELKKQGIHSLIIDVRNNGGGILQTARNIAANFVKEGALIHTKDRDGTDTPEVISGGTTVDFPVTMLVNEYSASASEVLTGALKDYGVANVLGTLTYGKGSVQSIFQLAGGAALKVTIEEYFRPLGAKVNHVGITPDIEVEGDMAQLITAVRNFSGGTKLSLDINKHNYVLNGGQFLGRIKTVREGDAVYVPSRLLAAMLDADVQWVGENNAVLLMTDKKTASFSLDSKQAINVDSVSYIDLAALVQQYPQLQWTITSAESVNITVAGE